MVEGFEPLQQRPGSMSCLPTVVTAILHYLKIEVTAEEISELCEEGPDGCVIDIAMDDDHVGNSGDYDVRRLTGDIEEELRQLVNDPNDPLPVLVTIKPLFSTEALDHAVAVIGITSEADDAEVVHFMDPLTGTIESLVYVEFMRQWDFAGQIAYLIT